MLSKLKHFIVAISLISFFACDRKMVFEDYRSLPELKWAVDSTVTFAFNISDTTINHNLYFNIRNSVDYEYSNLWLFVCILPPDSEAMKDTIEFTLANPLGKWFGKGHGKFRDIQYMYRRNVFFPDTGLYQFQIKQGMREQVLEGIRDIGLRVEKVE